jgi:8-oxo-dGTP pyrophosphatase MutT (NUDIX family)
MPRIASLVSSYLSRHPDERDRLDLLLRQLSTAEDLRDRRNFIGHVTASLGLMVGRHLLTIRHLSTGLRLLPGGHLDPGEHPAAGALREMAEETGIHIQNAGDLILVDIDTHAIADRPDRSEPAHVHHDFRYLVRMDIRPQAIAQTEEVDDAEWTSIDDVGFPRSLDGFLRKVRAPSGPA